ncbi:MAG: CBS domain-containing protein [Actinomycetota bacterium]
MTTEVATVTPTMPLREAASLLAAKGISGMPVLNTANEVVGVLSEADIVIKAGGEVARNRLLGWLLESNLDLDDKIRAETVGDAMTAPPVTIPSKRPVYEAARLMVAENVNRLPVVDKGKLVGIVTRADIVRAFTRSDAELVDEIRGDILRRTFWLEPGCVTVTVVDGHVTLRGEVETETDQELLPHFVARVPGVISVDADLSCRSKVSIAR